MTEEKELWSITCPRCGEDRKGLLGCSHDYLYDCPKCRSGVSGYSSRGRGMISNNIMIQDEGDDYIFYKASCACGSDDCTQTLELGFIDFKEAELKEVELNIYGNLGDYHLGFWERIKKAFKVLVYGYLEINSDFVFRGEKAIADYIKALEDGLEKVMGSE